MNNFERWFEGHMKLDYKQLHPESKRRIDPLTLAKAAFEAGYEAGWDDNDDITLCNAAANRGRE